jgi:hypothetical protein
MHLDRSEDRATYHRREGLPDAGLPTDLDPKVFVGREHESVLYGTCVINRYCVARNARSSDRRRGHPLV